MIKVCDWCHQKYQTDNKYHNSCNSCVEKRGSISSRVIDVPLKGSERWYGERWFRKDQKTWEADIRSRKALTANGEVVGRFNSKGERIG